MASLPDAALRSAYDAHGAELYRFARRSLGDAGMAEDAVQEAFVRAWRASRSLRPRSVLAADVAVRHPAQRGHRSRPRPSESPAAGRGDRTRTATATGPVDDEIDRVLTTWQVEAALGGAGRRPPSGARGGALARSALRGGGGGARAFRRAP